MFSLLRTAMTLLICILAVGFYLGWFSFHRLPPDPQSNKENINVSVDENKLRSDVQKVEQNLSKRFQEMNNQPQGNVGRSAFGPAAGHAPPEFWTGFPTALRPADRTAQRPAHGTGAIVWAVFPAAPQPARGTPQRSANRPATDTGLPVQRAPRCAPARRRPVGGRRKAEGRRGKAEGGMRKGEGGRTKVEGRRWKDEGGRRKVEGGSLLPALLQAFSPASSLMQTTSFEQGRGGN